MTLLEMLVAVALLVLMMLVLVSIFHQATGAISEFRAYQALDEQLRRLDSVIRADLSGVTAKMTPPNDPLDGKGYFEYSEGALADAQGEDSDDTLRFTVRAPEGQPFVGRVWVPWSVSSTNQTPIAYNTTSQYAEVVYFLRNHNLYRRVFLIAPSIFQVTRPVNNGYYPIGFLTTLFPISSTKLSAYSGAPYNLKTSSAIATQSISGNPKPASGFLVSWLGLNDISCRPSLGAAASLLPQANSLNDLTNREKRVFNPRFANDYITNSTGAAPPDGIPDDFNADGIDDWAPTLYYNSQTNGLLNEWMSGALIPPSTNIRPLWTKDTAAFPYVYPFSTSLYVGGSKFPTGTYHSLDPTVSPAPASGRPFFGTVLDPPFNHNPVDIGDSLPQPGTAMAQTWWGFPTWRETLSPNWVDPVYRLNNASGTGQQAPGLSVVNAANGWLPPQAAVGKGGLVDGMGNLVNPIQLYNDGTGSATFAMPNEVGQEDLIATNVRSFDVKALEQSPIIWNAAKGTYQPLPAGYYDLGYANLDYALGYTPPMFLDTFAHEGRIPPKTTDFRSDPQDPQHRPSTVLGDNSTNVLRLTRTWDSWSTDYTSVPGMPIYPQNGPLNGLATVMPSYPPPYTAPMRGIQIQIRIADPDNQHVKSLTIRQDFTDKL